VELVGRAERSETRQRSYLTERLMMGFAAFNPTYAP
jgi:hypothetical protein